MQYARDLLGVGIPLVAGETDYSQAPVQALVDWHQQKLLGKYVHRLGGGCSGGAGNAKAKAQVSHARALSLPHYACSQARHILHIVQGIPLSSA